MKLSANQRKLPVLMLAVLVFGAFTALLSNTFVNAQELQNRFVELSNPAASAISTDTFQFTPPTFSTIGSIVFEFCDNSPVIQVPCNPPPGLDVTAATLGSQSGNTGFSIDSADTTANQLVITRSPSTGQPVTTTYAFDNITNPSTPGPTVYVRIATYATTDGSGPYADRGAVAFTTSDLFNVAAYVPPFLKLCVGITVTTNCSSISGDSIDLGDLTTSHPGAGQSQFAVGTNSDTGYVLFALGTTMTSGNDVIPALSAPSPSMPGVSQFGINLRSNTKPSVGEEPAGAGIATPTPNYNSPNFFTYNNGDEIASSVWPSDYNRMTVSYLVNIDHGQPSGVYSTTITYLVTAQF